MKESLKKRRRTVTRNEWWDIRQLNAYITDERIGPACVPNDVPIKRAKDTAAFLRAVAQKQIVLADRIERWAE